MDLSPAATWNPPSDWMRITVVDSHTGGEPFRVVIDGLPEIPGDTVLARRRYAMEHLDHLRRILMWEPRGHADMYGGWIGPPVESDSDLSVLFLHNEGFSTMCGHGVIALAKVVLDTGILPSEPGETVIKIDTPAGQVIAAADVSNDHVTSVGFRNVPSFAAELDATVMVPGMGEVTYDLGFGGAFYAYVDARSVGVDMSDAAAVIATGGVIKEAISQNRAIEHSDDPDLGFLYAVIFTGPAENPANHSRNVCVFAEGQVDRSPTGTGVSGRLAILHARGDIGVGERITIESITGSEFSGQIVEETTVSDITAVVPEVTGLAHIVGRSEFWVDPSDELGRGFLVR